MVRDFLPRGDLERFFLELLSKFVKFHLTEGFVAVIEATKLCKIRPKNSHLFVHLNLLIKWFILKLIKFRKFLEGTHHFT